MGRHPNENIEPELFLGEDAPPDMRHAARQMANIQRELSQHKRHVLRTTGRWLDLFEYVKMLEEDHLYSSDAVAGHRQFFHGTIAIVRGLGTLLLAKLQNDDAEQLKALGLTYRDLAAAVEELVDLERALNSDITPEMVSEMNRQLFSSGEPTGQAAAV